MLDKHAISFGCLTTYLGFILGFASLVASEIFDIDHLGRWGVVSLGLACTYSIHRSLATNETRLWHAYELGRQHERRELTPVR